MTPNEFIPEWKSGELQFIVDAARLGIAGAADLCRAAVTDICRRREIQADARDKDLNRRLSAARTARRTHTSRWTETPIGKLEAKGKDRGNGFPPWPFMEQKDQKRTFPMLDATQIDHPRFSAEQIAAIEAAIETLRPYGGPGSEPHVLVTTSFADGRMRTSWGVFTGVIFERSIESLADAVAKVASRPDALRGMARFKEHLQAKSTLATLQIEDYSPEEQADGFDRILADVAK